MTSDTRPSIASSQVFGGTGVNNQVVANHLANPIDRYPKPPYPKQSQPWPGLASMMDPVPIMEKRATADPEGWRVARR